MDAHQLLTLPQESSKDPCGISRDIWEQQTWEISKAKGNKWGWSWGRSWWLVLEWEGSRRTQPPSPPLVFPWEGKHRNVDEKRLGSVQSSGEEKRSWEHLGLGMGPLHHCFLPPAPASQVLSEGYLLSPEKPRVLGPRWQLCFLTSSAVAKLSSTSMDTYMLLGSTKSSSGLVEKSRLGRGEDFKLGLPHTAAWKAALPHFTTL